MISVGVQSRCDMNSVAASVRRLTPTTNEKICAPKINP